MVKILGMSGSPRKKSCVTALTAALSAAESTGGVETELIELRAKKINPCIHCNKCLRDESDRCTVFANDDMAPLYDKFFEADGILIMSPVYDMNITPQLAQFFSRFRSSWRKSAQDPYFFMKKVGAAMAVGGTRNGGQENIINNIFNFYSTHGITICNGGGSIYAGASLWNPGDGSTLMDDPAGMANAVGLGKKLAVLTKAMKSAEWDEKALRNMEWSEETLNN